MNVLIYAGPDTAPTPLAHTFASLRTLLAPNYAVQPIDQKALQTQPWKASCALLALPPFKFSSTPSPFAPATRAEIQKFVAGGGRLLALGTGVRIAARRVRGATGVSALSTQLASIGIASPAADVSPLADKLTLEDEDAERLAFSLVPGSQSEQDVKANTTSIRLGDGSQLEGVLRAGAVDIPQTVTSYGRLEPLAHYTSNDSPDVAGIKASIGRGAAAFWSAHIEAPVADHSAHEQARLQTLRMTLETLGLRLPQQASHEPPITPRPTPQILTGAPWRVGVIDTIIRALEIPDLSSVAPYTLKDRHDTFVFHPREASGRVFAEQREAVKTLSDDPETWNPKHIVVYSDNAVPPNDLTPKFDVGTYYEELKAARVKHGCRETYVDSPWGVGEALLYGEIVTSTQTMLDKNTRLLDALPTPFLSLASTQLTGRGRGANVWLSPPGCLMFSLLLRVPLAALPAQKIVFIQYLFALAVADACRSDGVLGDEAGSRVRIKWPNDIYGITQEGEKNKLGGILVNTSFGAGKVEVVIGCGLNVLNDPPILSLAQLLRGGRAPPTMERTLAAIMTRFERMWDDFLSARGSFEPFMDLYLERWLHSDQEVTLTTVTPPRKVRIVGITPDHGLLRTLPEPGRGGSMEYIDLQPDGNSFDLLAGLIKTKV
ncbi:hypothetical protein GSI_09283 [Ganoderma sinense ZZ0214-1]|uniref:BPL/LPL catalytic domain-containing protein n=1 Tax=Ganoderma sinense ZZ0214-1 TaxID=1077348 RepID=A0A2G8S675_9APHY|nr:hypothetical protein GSI_09283 [Ganoderma sinense ZZ0214-1]